MRDTEEGVGVVGEKIGDEAASAAEVEAVAFEAVVEQGPSPLTGCMFGVGGCWEPLVNPLLSPSKVELDSELEELDG
jgi:hypothetical protein